MKKFVILQLIVVVIASQSSCIFLPIPYLNQTFIAQKQLPGGDDLIVSEIVTRHSEALLPAPCVPFQDCDIAVRLVAINGDHLPSQSHCELEWFGVFFGFGMFPLPLPGYMWEHDTHCLKVYRPGYHTIALHNFNLSTGLDWTPASNFAEQEQAIDELLYSSTRAEDRKRPLSEIDVRGWFNEDVPDENSGSWKRNFSPQPLVNRITQTRRALACVALEYRGLEARLPHSSVHQELRERLAAKAEQLEWLSKVATTKELEECNVKLGPEKFTEVAAGTVSELVHAAKILVANNIEYMGVGEASGWVKTSGCVKLYVKKADIQRAIPVLVAEKANKNMNMDIDAYLVR